MSMLTLNRMGLGLFAAVAVVGTSACKTVSPDDMEASLQALRSEMQSEIAAGDDAVMSETSGRIDAVERRMAQLEADLAEMEAEFEVQIARLEDELRFNVPVYFAFGDATVQPGAEPILARFGRVVGEYYPDAMITVEGFTDPAGDEAYNLWLGEQRANAVAAHLVGNTSVSEDQVRAVSYGEDTRRLVANGWGPGEEGWQNRRVVLVIDHDGRVPAMISGAEAPRN